METRCVTHRLESKTMDNSISNQSALSFDQLFELNELKAQSQEKDTVIKKLKERIKSLSGKMNEDKIKKDPEEIETINIELDHRVLKLIDENEHLKLTYKQLYDSIKPTRIRSKEQCDDLISQVNLKSVEISDLNASLQEKVLVITTLKDNLRKLKGKTLVDNDVTKHPSDPEMLKIDVEQITPKLLNKKTAHSTYIKHTQEETTILRDLVEHVKSKYPLDHSLESACRPTGQTFTIIGNTCPLTRITITTEVPIRNPNALDNETSKPVVTLVYLQKPRKYKTNVPVSKSTVLKSVIQIVLWYLDSSYSKHMTEDRSQLTNFVNKFLGTVKFRNDHVAKILGYGDYQIGNVTISRVYYVEGLGHNLFLVGQFCNSNLEVAFRQHTCFIRNLEGKSKKKPHKPKSKDTNQEKLYLLHMDLCGPMRVVSVNGKKYILIIVDDYSRFTWVKCLRSKDEAPDSIIKFLKMIQVRLKVPVRRIRTNNGTEFVNQTLREYYEKVGISHETSIDRSLQQNGVVERQNRTLIDVARTMLIYAKAPLFLWAKAVATTYFDELTTMDSEYSSLGPALHEMTHVIISLGIVRNPPPSTPFVPPSRTDWDILFQPLFDEYLTPPPSVDNPTPKVIALIDEVVAPELDASTDSPSLTTVDQDAPSASISQTTHETPSPVIPDDIEENNHDLDIAHMDNDPYFSIPIPEVPSDQSSSTNSTHTIVHPDHQISKNNRKWTKDHPLENIISELARP
ncbi:retrovirus-related pol polyprotein from transposon TNT 1-94, partial [Tanacetum coccineum]